MSEYEAGRDTDALVAERLHNRPHGFYHWDGEVVPGALPYSTEIAAAWTLVEAVREWWSVKVAAGKKAWDHTPLYECAFVQYADEDNPSRNVSHAMADTAALAIVRAFLVATEP